jgi:glycosyltransferase involved in cell wall biosynthesis
MRVLVISFYYEPDLSAGSFRNTALVKKLAERLGGNGQVDVITTLPNRYHTFAVKAQEFEAAGNIRVWRVALPAHQSGLTDQARAFASYAKAVWQQTRGQKYDIVYASSSRLMSAMLGAIICRSVGALLYLDIRDIFTDSFGDLVAKSPLRLTLPFFRFIERFAVRRADRVNLVSPGFTDHFRAMDESKDFQFFTNGIDDEFIEYDYTYQSVSEKQKEILYAGNIGSCQGLQHIIPAVARRLGSGWRIRIIGDGGMRPALVKMLEGVDNVFLEAPIHRKDLLECYRKADVLFLHLNDYPAYRKVLPSKLFEYAATGKPVLAGVAGQAAEFLKDNVENSAVFKPCDSDGFIQALGTLSLINKPRTSFVDQYRRTIITEQLADDILSLGLSRK